MRKSKRDARRLSLAQKKLLLQKIALTFRFPVSFVPLARAT